MLIEYLYDKKKSKELETNLHRTSKGPQISLSKIAEKPKITIHTDRYGLKHVVDKSFVQVDPSKSKDDKPNNSFNLYPPNLSKGL